MTTVRALDPQRDAPCASGACTWPSRFFDQAGTVRARPIPEIVAHLPSDWGLQLSWSRDVDGTRIFWPAASATALSADSAIELRREVGREFLLHAYIGGLTSYISDGVLTADQRSKCYVAWCLWQRLHGSHDYARREFAGPRDLTRTPGCIPNEDVADLAAHLGRRSYWLNEPTIIPGAFRARNSFGVGGDRWPNATGPDQSFRVRELLELGCKAAADAGVPAVTNRDAVRHGLIEIARRATALRIPTDGKDLICRALLDSKYRIGPDGRTIRNVPPQQVRQAVVRVLYRMAAGDLARFDQVLTGSAATFTTRVAEQCRGLSRECVRAAIVQLAPFAIERVGRCVDRLMRVVRDAIAPPLTGRERAIFDMLYIGQPYLGRIPLMMLVDRWGFLMPAIDSLILDPSRRAAIATLKRALFLYGELLAERRAGDVRRHRRRKEQTT